jgi:hypothetical protein
MASLVPVLRKALSPDKLKSRIRSSADDIVDAEFTDVPPRLTAGKVEPAKKGLTLGQKLAAGTGAVGTAAGLASLYSTDSEEEAAAAEETTEKGLTGFSPPTNKQDSDYQKTLDEFAKYQKEQANIAEKNIKDRPEESLDALQAQISKMYEGLDKKDREWMQSKQEKFNSLYQDAIDQRDKNISRVEWGQIAQTLAQAFATIGAAAQGLRTGRDTTTGLRFSPVNWDRQFDRVEQDYRVAVGDIRRQETDFEDTEKQSSGIRREMTREQTNNLIRNFVNQKSESGQLEREAKKVREDAFDAAIKAGYARERAEQEAQKAMLNTGAAKQLAKRDRYLELAKAGILNEEKPAAISKKIIDAGGTAEQAKQITDLVDGWWAKPDQAINLIDKLKAPLADSPKPINNKQPLSPEDVQALNWARQNPEDPRATQIFNRLGQQ